MITKAIIPVAGWGTRRLPITKTIEKCMLPIGNRPIVDYVVQDCLAAGITEIYFVVGEQSTQLQNYYRSNIPLNDYLVQNGKEEKLPLIAPLEGVSLHFIVQPTSYGKYGTAVPIALAADYVKNDESVVVLMGDDFFYNPDGSSEVKRLIEGTPEGQNGILGAVLPEDDTVTGRYGSIEVNERDELIRIDEYPETLPQPFIKNVSKYLLNGTMVKAVKNYVETAPVEGEYYIFTPFEQLLATTEVMKLVRASGMYLDGGSVEGWLHANNVVVGA
ncbi:MAG TPA: sugar phosphate nucleotidyltransferase [Candidatus Saccharibacteria bacterium]|nr:sugar phosphate nucleotidyltransferase [Candidatus Saccharibacteria bacterium]HRK94316.1 sugar phosphate nucleotidyltransferase [Candidatus Saccharibacteria bacterium]